MGWKDKQITDRLSFLSAIDAERKDGLFVVRFSFLSSSIAEKRMVCFLSALSFLLNQKQEESSVCSFPLCSTCNKDNQTLLSSSNFTSKNWCPLFENSSKKLLHQLNGWLTKRNLTLLQCVCCDSTTFYCMSQQNCFCFLETSSLCVHLLHQEINVCSWSYFTFFERRLLK